MKLRFDRSGQTRSGSVATDKEKYRAPIKRWAGKQKPRRAATLRGFAAITGGDGGIRTLDPGFGPDAPLAGECLRPLGHVSQTVLVRGGSLSRRDVNHS